MLRRNWKRSVVFSCYTSFDVVVQRECKLGHWSLSSWPGVDTKLLFRKVVAVFVPWAMMGGMILRSNISSTVFKGYISWFRNRHVTTTLCISIVTFMSIVLRREEKKFLNSNRWGFVNWWIDWCFIKESSFMSYNYNNNRRLPHWRFFLREHPVRRRHHK